MRPIILIKPGSAQVVFFSSVFILDEPSAFYAEEIYDSTEGLGTNDEKLQRIFIQRSEVGDSILL